MKNFILEGNYDCFLSSFGINVGSALCRTRQPEDLFRRPRPMMTTENYFAFMTEVGAQIADTETIVAMGTAEELQTFSPPIFAAYCSQDGQTCLERLARYKKLIGPLAFHVTRHADTVSLTMQMAEGHRELPPFLVQVESVFLVNLLRRGTQSELIPLAVTMTELPAGREIEDFLGVTLTKGDGNTLVFRRSDMELPFVTRNEAMWEYLQPELSRRLSEMDIDDSFAVRVRSALTELLPGGNSSIEAAAGKLGLSKRTLQRKLSAEHTTFQQQLNHTRELLAKHYLQNTTLTIDDIAYLLDYQESNSFQRAFSLWTGQSLSEYRKNHHRIV